MYPIGRNKTVFTQEIFDEAYNILWGEPYRKATRKYILIFAAILIAGFAFMTAIHLPVFYLVPGLLGVEPSVDGKYNN